MIDSVGQVLAGRYRLSRLLGSGGMGSVFLAELAAGDHAVRQAERAGVTRLVRQFKERRADLG